MARIAQDPGFGREFEGKYKRIINRDGSFNVEREGGGFSLADSYQFLINIKWRWFLLLTFGLYITFNALYALIYVIIGVDDLSGVTPGSFFDNYSAAFFFSVQTFTTVGYGAMAPMGKLTSFVASIEALTGLLGFALATGLLYGRFSKPNARLRFSRRALISPYRDGSALMFRFANLRANVLMECEARVLLVITQKLGNESIRRYHSLPLETDKIHFLPLTWTVVHPIDQDSPLYGLNLNDMKDGEMEVLTLIKGYDDNFSQMIHVRHSYTYKEIVYGAKYIRAFANNEEGDTVLDLDSIHDYESVPLPQPAI